MLFDLYVVFVDGDRVQVLGFGQRRERVRHARASDLLVWDTGNVDADRERKIACVLDDSG